MPVQALKERLVERANIIQARHDAETAALVKRQVCSARQLTASHTHIHTHARTPHETDT